MADETRPPNRLAGETSPYLLQHAYNPVDWRPWGDEAFSAARERDVPVLLSVGYAACHWCHVMERESFEDPRIAALMNELYVPVKVDREERPDVDAIYMGAVQAMTGHGGWPMTVFLTPDGVPFLGGTYFPPEDRHGMPGFPRVLEHVAELWRTRRDDLLRQGAEVLRHLTAAATPPASSEPLSDALLSGAAAQLLSAHDPVHGGFGTAPKFPQAPVLELALRLARRGFDMREPVNLTLTRMALGGIYDQIGGGFARYSVDERWLVPHFEKMLYDNAQLARVYTHAWQAYGEELYERIAVETLEYLLRDMRDDAGGFHSSEDADSEGEEGRFYVWDYDEFVAVAPGAVHYYGVTADGNFEGSSILTARDIAPPPAAERSALFEARSRRVRPGVDDKVLASWNGLAIAALAEAGTAFARPDFVEAAREAARFVLGTMRDASGRLLHSYRAGTAKIPALLEDNAYLADGLLELWHATFEAEWLDACRALVRDAVDRFSDPRAGGFYSTASDAERLIVRQKEVGESATPAPGAVLAIVAQKLAVLDDDADLARTAVDAVRVAYPYMDRAAQAAGTWLQALDLYLAGPLEIAFLGDLGSGPGAELVAEAWRRYLPERVMAAATQPTDDRPLLRDKRPIDGRPTAFVCERYVCGAPVSEPAALAEQLDARARHR